MSELSTAADAASSRTVSTTGTAAPGDGGVRARPESTVHDDDSAPVQAATEEVPVKVVTEKGAVKVATEGEPAGVVTGEGSVEVAIEGESVEAAAEEVPVKVATEGEPAGVVTGEWPVEVATEGDSVEVVTEGESVEVVAAGEPVEVAAEVDHSEIQEAVSKAPTTENQPVTDDAGIHVGPADVAAAAAIAAAAAEVAAEAAARAARAAAEAADAAADAAALAAAVAAATSAGNRVPAVETTPDFDDAMGIDADADLSAGTAESETAERGTAEPGVAEAGAAEAGDDDYEEAEGRPRGLQRWMSDRRRDRLGYISVPVVTLFAAPVLVAFWGIVILGSDSYAPSMCDNVRAVNGCEELTWGVIRVHVLGFLGVWALLWVLPWWRGLRQPRVLLALLSGAVLFAAVLRMAA
ncbi:hypothetical protein [Actinoplanes xinjiangensis]|uniref:Uncharacterized protein n=1 Tax=Actinoplanes xinjiangensis TaxID=512350 RepID=A0A316G3E8_9ACTN|nr:hypothetical protein [Actinoplanes xinjiangensis]PWK48917.1 hypothetical protein BC793_105267 [Actinoplanes xinjiangensis]GIF38624.1 hypothetical protein Axi01nite_29350 [Actinoplanes xinjiangensis]